MKEKISITMEKDILSQIDSIIDNIYIRNRSQAIEHLVNNSLGGNNTAVILAGGEDNELSLGGEVRATSKVKNSSVIELAIKKLRDSGFKNIFVVAREKALTKIFNILKDGSSYGIKIAYVEEKESKGSAHSLRLLKGRISTTFLAVYADIIFDKISIDSLWTDHLRHNSIATLLLTTSSEPSLKGTVKVEGDQILEFNQKVKRADNYLVFSPLFVVEPEIFNYSGDSLEFDVFPELSTKGFLRGRISSEKETHIHTLEDIKIFNKKNK